MDRENLFTLQLGNVAPDDRIIIRLAYFQQVERLEDQLSLRIPFTPGVRYIPGTPLLRANRGRGTEDDTDQVPDASRLTPPRITGDHHDAATMHLLGVFDEGEADMRSLMSPTHTAVIRTMEATLEVELAGEAQIPDRDFVLRWTECAAVTPVPRSWACQANGHTYALLQLRAPQIENMAAQEDDFAQDIYFLVDRSGSMEGVKWLKCAEALQAFVKELGARDRVWITCFESSFQDFAEAPMLRDKMLADRGFQKLAELGTAGGTELLPALCHVLEARHTHSKENPSRIVLITDGQVGNESTIIDIMKDGPGRGVPMHCFGIDTAVNDAFLLSLARQTSGRCALMTPDDDIAAAVKRLAQSLRRPVLTGLTLQGDFQTTDDSPSLPDLNAGEVTLLAVRASADAQEATITGRLPDGRDWTQSVPFQRVADTEAPRLLWAKRRCAHLVETGHKKQAVEIATAHNVACRGASFVAWDEQEKVGLAKREVYQPSLARGGRFQMLAAGAAPMAKPAAAPMKKLRFGGSGIRTLSKSLGKGIAEFKTREEADGAATQRLADEPGHFTAGFSSAPSLDETLRSEIGNRYGSRVKSASRSARAWSQRLRDRLVADGLSRPLADAIFLVVVAWMSDGSNPEREQELVNLLQRFGIEGSMLGSMRRFIRDHVTHSTAPPPETSLLEALREFVEKHIAGQERSDLLQLLGGSAQLAGSV
jgi:Ca-activated chloride channel family protein